MQGVPQRMELRDDSGGWRICQKKRGITMMTKEERRREARKAYREAEATAFLKKVI